MTDTAKPLTYEELEAINERQAQTIAMLRNAPSLFHEVLTASEKYVTRFRGHLTEDGTVSKVDEEVYEFKTAFRRILFTLFNDAATMHLDVAMPPLDELRGERLHRLIVLSV